MGRLREETAWTPRRDATRSSGDARLNIGCPPRRGSGDRPMCGHGGEPTVAASKKGGLDAPHAVRALDARHRVRQHPRHHGDRCERLAGPGCRRDHDAARVVGAGPGLRAVRDVHRDGDGRPQPGTTPTGAVQFKVDTVDVGGPVVLVAGRATYTTSSLSIATHEVAAVIPKHIVRRQRGQAHHRHGQEGRRERRGDGVAQSGGRRPGRHVRRRRHGRRARSGRARGPGAVLR